MGKVLFVVKGDISKIPPCVSHIRALVANGYSVVLLVGSISEPMADELGASGVKVLTPERRLGAQDGAVSKSLDWLTFRDFVIRWLKEVDGCDFKLWIGTGDTALCLADVLLKRRGFVLCLLELYDSVPHYRFLLGRVASRAERLVVPEETRGQIMSAWWRLTSPPVVIPNKPTIVEFSEQDVEFANSAWPEELEGYRVVLYQGLLSPERDLAGVARAVEELGDPYRLVVMGENEHSQVERLQAIHPGLVHIEYVPAPAHLLLTRRAWAGVATYNQDSLNTLFCAPNKIYEYGAFGVPVLANQNPGLRLTVGTSGAGVCVDTNDAAQVRAALLAIEEAYVSFSVAAKALYAAVDIPSLVRQALASDAR